MNFHNGSKGFSSAGFSSYSSFRSLNILTPSSLLKNHIIRYFAPCARNAASFIPGILSLWNERDLKIFLVVRKNASHPPPSSLLIPTFFLCFFGQGSLVVGASRYFSRRLLSWPSSYYVNRVDWKDETKNIIRACT